MVTVSDYSDGWSGLVLFGAQPIRGEVRWTTGNWRPFETQALSDLRVQHRAASSTDARLPRVVMTTASTKRGGPDGAGHKSRCQRW